MKELVVLAAVLWGFTPLLFRMISVAPISAAFYRFLFVSIALLIYFKRIPKFYWSNVFLGVTSALTVVMYFMAIKQTSLGEAAFLLYTGPFVAAMLSYFFLKEKLRKDLPFLIVELIGISLLFFTERIGLNIFGLMAGLTYGLMLFFAGKYRRRDPLEATFWMSVVATLMLSPTMIVPSTKDILILGVMGIFCTLVPHFLIFKALKKLPQSTVDVLLYIEPATATMFGFIVFSEHLLPQQLFGVLLIIVSVLSSVKRKLK